ncbi:hypothetical protein [Cohnella herbarum]|uniref:Uncharacterized protein n=1 Tax=Cohnella herbarum TaxID=2728023 RepID=A0A7Z2ZPG0_9BACL|nr:hypothetical protein [Cohnella herbarum]QJD85957.1 hypothetical protein HH215_24130 [Cohnella herbarum]
MNSNKVAAKIVGVLFILAAVSSIIGLSLYDPILKGPDYLIKGSEHANQLGRRLFSSFRRFIKGNTRLDLFARPCPYAGYQHDNV